MNACVWVIGLDCFCLADCVDRAYDGWVIVEVSIPRDEIGTEESCLWYSPVVTNRLVSSLFSEWGEFSWTCSSKPSLEIGVVRVIEDWEDASTYSWIVGEDFEEFVLVEWDEALKELFLIEVPVIDVSSPKVRVDFNSSCRRYRLTGVFCEPLFLTSTTFWSFCAIST